MSYPVEYMNCRICGSDSPKFLGFRGNLEYMGAPKSLAGKEHMVTSVVKCKRCGFVYTNPKIILPAEQRCSFYNDPEKYHSSICPDSREMFNKTLNLMERFNRQKGRLLDVGTGKAEFLAAARKRGWQVSGVEPSGNFVQYTKEKFGLQVQNSTLEEANFPEDYFDAVTLNMVLEHIDQPHSLLSTIYKILKKDGLLYIEVPNMDSMLLKLIKIYYMFTGKDWSPHLSPLHYPYHCYGYGRSALRALCQRNGFTIKKFFIFGIGLRGFRPYAGRNKFKEKARNILANFFGLVNQGDILIAVALKNEIRI